MVAKRSAKPPRTDKARTEIHRTSVSIGASNAPPRTEFTARLAKSRQTIATCFVQCLAETGTSQELAARAMGVTKRTAGAWARCESPIAVERVLAAPRLAKAFRAALCTFDHSHGSAPYVLKQRKRSA